jgi:hypothetical protein
MPFPIDKIQTLASQSIGGRPMRRSSIIIVCVLFFALLCSSSLFAQEESWSLVGSWINKTYDKTGNPSAKVVYGADGVLIAYRHLSDHTGYKTVYTIEKSWTEKGAHWFKAKMPIQGRTVYEIDKLTEGGNKYESVFDWDKYPSTFDTTSPSYAHTIRYRE